MIDGPYIADGRVVRKKPVHEPYDGGTRITIGFPVATMHDICSDQAEAVAGLMNLGDRAQWRPLPPANEWPGEDDVTTCPAFAEGNGVVIGRWRRSDEGWRWDQHQVAYYSRVLRYFRVEDDQIGQLSNATHFQLLSPPPERETDVSMPAPAMQGEDHP